jgi:hypothetical protein
LLHHFISFKLQNAISKIGFQFRFLICVCFTAKGNSLLDKAKWKDLPFGQLNWPKVLHEQNCFKQIFCKELGNVTTAYMMGVEDAYVQLMRFVKETNPTGDPRLEVDDKTIFISTN